MQAPTDNMNFVVYNYGELKYAYELYYEGSIVNYYTLKSVEISATKNYPGIGDLEVNRTYSPGDVEIGKDEVTLYDGDLRFKPSYEITALTNEGMTYITAYRNQPFEIEGEKLCPGW